MSHVDSVLGVKRAFVKVLEALSQQECRFNRRLRDKTEQVATLFAKISDAKQTDAAMPTERAAQGEPS